jgi:hypothetical protein
VVEILRVEIRWLGQCFEVGGALREPGHDAHGYVTYGSENIALRRATTTESSTVFPHDILDLGRHRRFVSDVD